VVRRPVASNDVAAVEHDGDERLPAQVAGCDCHAAAQAARREVAADQPNVGYRVSNSGNGKNVRRWTRSPPRR
jgi:hypothetical protein